MSTVEIDRTLPHPPESLVRRPVIVVVSSSPHKPCTAGVVSSVTQKDKEFRYCVQIDSQDDPLIFTGDELALADGGDRLEVGAQCVAVKDSTAEHGPKFYPGVIGEVPAHSNRRRCLVFFAAGWSAYCDPSHVKPLLSGGNAGSIKKLQSSPIWRNVQPRLRAFLRDYFASLGWARPMVKVTGGQKIHLELEASQGTEWFLATVAEVDCSLARVQYKDDILAGGKIREEWIYRGSHRIQELKEFVADPSKSVDAETCGKIISRSIETHGKERTVPDEVHELHSTSCLGVSSLHQDLLREESPLLVPLCLGWTRDLRPDLDSKTGWTVEYTAPCGKKLRSLQEVHSFLVECGNTLLAISRFTFDPWVRVRDEFKMFRSLVNISDISYGKELTKIPCVNSVDHTFPPYLEYSTEILPQTDVMIASDPGFLTCCDCTNDCVDKEKCACAKLTIQATLGEGMLNMEAGYDFQLLKDIVQTGIYECNSLCACSRTCHNRVAQSPPRPKLQIFKTQNRGWGLRSLVDIPQGGFICQYVGKMYNSDEGNVQGQTFGDDYFTDLDLIEIVESKKEGYESGVDDMLDDQDTEEDTKGSKRFVSVRKYFGPKEDIMIVDALHTGNLGRYMNHSCDPNVFVQNVFIDSHDLRFHRVCFFTYKYVRAGDELCWNYSYEIGSVPGKEIPCHCGSSNCKGRMI